MKIQLTHFGNGSSRSSKIISIGQEQRPTESDTFDIYDYLEYFIHRLLNGWRSILTNQGSSFIVTEDNNAKQK